MPSLARRMVAEAFGTFVLVFCGCAIIIANYYPGAGSQLLGTAITHGLALGVAITATMAISGGHLNPAVTIGLAAVRRIDLRTAAGYIAAQLIGAVIAALLVKLVMPSNVGRLVAWGTPLINASVTLQRAIALETIAGFILVSAVFGTAVSPIAPRVAGFGIGLVLIPLILIVGPLTGAAVNPARAFGPALVSGTWVGHVAFWIGPILGGILAALLWHFVLLPRLVVEEVVVAVEK